MRRAIAVLALVTLVAATLKQDQRPPDQTFLTYPEWFLVFSPAEYAAHTRAHDPSTFPFFGHIGQFWQGYDAVWNATRGRYPFNGGYHVMIMVIGTSTTVEYALRGAYETIFGRLAELTRRHGFTSEEKLASRYAQEYVDFIRVRPWYEFDFASRLKTFWLTTGFWGNDPIRKWERKYAITSEFAVKAVYGWMIAKATHATYDPALDTTAVLTTRNELLMLPRYEAFMTAATKLARQGVQFQEIAGNRGEILLSVLAPEGSPSPDRVLMRQPILTEKGTERMLIAVPVSGLAGALQRYARVEHVFDY